LLPGLIDQTVGVVLPRERPAEPAAGLSPTRTAKPLTAAEQRALRPGDSFKECDDCPAIVVIPAGEQMVGSNDSEQSERPPYKVVIAKPFAVGKFEVIFAEWDACISDNGCTHKPNDQGWGRDRRPVVDVSADHIQMQYIPWLRRKTGRDYRLLTEGEWEYSARAGTSTTYPWGNEAGRNRANCDGCADKWSKQSAPIGSFAANGFGLHDMHGNVWEIVSDCWHRNHQGASSDASTRIMGDCTRRVIRGGSWYTSAKFIRSATRDSDPISYKNSNVGFRVARTLD
jgi:formylglycine-generating enzyme required for sulfatase activity